jgi:uncharacterized protein YqeY
MWIANGSSDFLDDRVQKEPRSKTGFMVYNRVMTLLEQLNNDMKAAMKSGDKERLEVIRFALAGVNAALKEKVLKTPGTPFTDEEVIAVLQKDAKRRRDAIELFKQGKRDDLVKKEESDLVVIMGYLPAEMSVKDIEKTVDDLYKKGFTDFNALMREAMKVMKGRADGKMVGDVIKKKLG